MVAPELGINFNGNLSREEVAAKARAAERNGVRYLWVGESKPLVHPFPIMTLLAESTTHATIGSAILSAMSNRCFHIAKAFRVLREAYGQRFIAGIAPGDLHGLKVECIASRGVVARLEKCISRIKGVVPVFVGASGPKLIELASIRGEGVILNYAHPEFIKWALRHVRRERYLACIAPALVLPDKENMAELMGAAAVVASGANPVFIADMGIEEKVTEIRNMVKRDRWNELAEHENFLLEYFTISGSVDEVVERIEELAKLGMKQVILGSPFVKSIAFEKIINSISERLGV